MFFHQVGNLFRCDCVQRNVSHFPQGKTHGVHLPLQGLLVKLFFPKVQQIGSFQGKLLSRSFFGLLHFERLPVKLEPMFDQGVVFFRFVPRRKVRAFPFAGQRIIPVALPRACAPLPFTNGHEVLPSCADVPGGTLLDTWLLGQHMQVVDAE